MTGPPSASIATAPRSRHGRGRCDADDGAAAADRRQQRLVRMVRGPHRRGSRLQPRADGVRDRERHEHAARRRTRAGHHAADGNGDSAGEQCSRGGTVTVAANASDNVAAASVQFLLDGQPLGAADTTTVPRVVEIRADQRASLARGPGRRCRGQPGNIRGGKCDGGQCLSHRGRQQPCSGASVSGTINVDATALIEQRRGQRAVPSGRRGGPGAPIRRLPTAARASLERYLR